MDSDHPDFQLYTPTLQSKGSPVVVSVLVMLVASSVVVPVSLALVSDAVVLVPLVVLVRLLVADGDVLTP